MNKIIINTILLISISFIISGCGSNSQMALDIKNNNIANVQKAITSGENINNIDTFPLLEAVDYNRIEILKLLIKNGANLNMYTDEGVTALHVAVRNNNKEAINILLKNGAKFNPSGEEKRSYIAEAFEYSYKMKSAPYKSFDEVKKMIDFLISKGLKPIEIDTDSGKPTIFATTDLKEIKYLESKLGFSIYSNWKIAGENINILSWVLKTSNNPDKEVKYFLSKCINIYQKRNHFAADTYAEAKGQGHLNAAEMIIQAAQHNKYNCENIKIEKAKDE